MKEFKHIRKCASIWRWLNRVQRHLRFILVNESILKKTKRKEIKKLCLKLLTIHISENMNELHFRICYVLYSCHCHRLYDLSGEIEMHEIIIIRVVYLMKINERNLVSLVHILPPLFQYTSLPQAE